MTNCLGKSCSFGLLGVTLVNRYQIVCVILSLFMPPTSKKLRGQIGLILSVWPSWFLAETV